MLKDIKEITYRGALKSCNYTCSYCVFAKNKMSTRELSIDENDWNRFCTSVSNSENEIRILVAPYGEALIHDYYTKGIAKLSKQNNIKSIGVQTNLSLNTEKWIDFLKDEDADLSKIKLWCTYHPSMTTIHEFVAKVKYLSKFINLSVGVVGDVSNIEEIKKLREALPINIYLWINNMDGVRKKYNDYEIEVFKEIDPLFSLELRRYDKDNTCSCYKNHRFIKANGDLYYCNRNPKVVGNLYKESMSNIEIQCSKKRCDCYLAYSHLSSLKELNFFNYDSLIRVPRRLNLEAIFFDLDGTLINNNKVIDAKTRESLRYISTKTSIYLVTQRPYDEAMKKCNSIKDIISGGIFASGAHVIDKNLGYEKYEYLPEIYDFKGNKEIKCYSNYKKIYKVFTKNKNNEFLSFAKNNTHKFKIINTRGRYSIVSKNCSKLNGILDLCKNVSINKEKIMVIGNDNEDLDMISNIKYSVAVTNSNEKIKHSAKYVLDVNSLPYII